MSDALLLFPRALFDSPFVMPHAGIGSVAASIATIAYFPLQWRFAGEAQWHKDSGTVCFIGEHGVALAQDLSAPNAAQLITQFGRLPPLCWLQLAVGHLQTVFPQQADAIR
jgi:hypothetical protein